jgi:hypothetical protein
MGPAPALYFSVATSRVIPCQFPRGRREPSARTESCLRKRKFCSGSRCRRDAETNSITPTRRVALKWVALARAGRRWDAWDERALGPNLPASGIVVHRALKSSLWRCVRRARPNHPSLRYRAELHMCSVEQITMLRPGPAIPASCWNLCRRWCRPRRPPTAPPGARA